jgi:two-component system, cell cycle sensor histidine kinase and response regulator CckA
LKESEEKYRALVENSLQGLSIIQDDRFVFCNNALAAMTGYSIEELMAFPHSIDLVHPEDRATIYKRRQDRIEGKPVPSPHVHRIIKKDGSIRWMEVIASIIALNGRPATQVVNMDITERRETEIALQKSEERFRSLLETTNDWVWEINSDGVYTYVSPKVTDLLGYSPEEVIGKEPYDFMSKDEAARVTASLKEAVKSRQPFSGLQNINRHKDGREIVLETNGAPHVDPYGNPLYHGISRDITYRKRVEEELRESREYLAQIINQISDPIFVKNSEHNYVLVNDALCTFEGRSREQLLGHASFDDLPENLAASLFEREAEVFRTGQEGLSEDTITDRNGKNHTLLAKKSLLVDKKGNRQIVGVLRDITEHKHLEAQFMQAQKMEAIGVLAGGVAHDFNNLLNVINGYCELLLEDLAEDNPMHKDILQISQAGTRAKSLTSQLLAFSRNQILQPAILDLNDIIDSTNLMLRRLIPEDIDLVIIAQPGLGLIYADPGQIQQVLMNLIVNARDAMPQGGKLTIETANVEHDAGYIQGHPVVKVGPYTMLAISDNGVGMDEATQAHLFEPFFTTKEKGKGTGLGLSTVYGIVKQSNGFIWVYSEPGKGATFKIYFPRVEGNVSNIKEQPESEEKARGVETVLITEDESSVRNLVARILRERGYIVLEASNGQNALDIAREYTREIHLAITDIIMPGMNGRDLGSRLEAMRPGIKVLYVSGYTDNAIVHHGILDSGVAFLQKPFTVGGLTRKVREMLNPS